LSLSSTKYGVGIRDPEKDFPDPGSGSKGQKGTGSRIRIRNTERKSKLNFFLLIEGFGSVQKNTNPDPGGPKIYGSGSGRLTIGMVSFIFKIWGEMLNWF
jgi:hypothetical protein